MPPDALPPVPAAADPARPTPTPETTPAFRLSDFAVGGPEGKPAAAAPRPEPAPDPYRDDEIAELVGNLSGFGLPLPVLDAYTRAFVARSAPILALLQAGEALAELGIHKGSGVGQAPAWLRAAAAGVGLAVVVVMTRRQFAQAGRGDESGDWTSAPGGADPGSAGDGGGHV